MIPRTETSVLYLSHTLTFLVNVSDVQCIFHIGVWTRREADVFLDVALRMGVPRGSILLETEATNTGENIRFSHRVLKERNIPGGSSLAVPVNYYCGICQNKGNVYTVPLSWLK